MIRILLILSALFATQCHAQEWNRDADRVCQSMIRHFWGASFEGAATQKYFNASASQASMKNEWWWQAHAMDVIIDAYVRTADRQYLDFYEPWYEGIIGSNYEHFDDDVLHNNSIDDMEWICITLIRMTQTSGDRRYLDHARRLYERYIVTTWGPEDEAPWHGGISWSSDKAVGKTKNACSNGPAGIIAAMLGKDDDLRRIYLWERRHLYDKTTGAVWDHLSYNGVSKALHSYNTATFIAMAAYLYQLTHEQSLLDDITRATDFAIAHFGVGDRRLMSLVSNSDRGGDAGLFHGIFFRYLAQIINSCILPEAKQQQYRQYLFDNAHLAMSSLSPDTDIFPRDWAGMKITSAYGAPLTPHVTGATLISAVASLR